MEVQCGDYTVVINEDQAAYLSVSTRRLGEAMAFASMVEAVTYSGKDDDFQDTIPFRMSLWDHEEHGKALRAALTPEAPAKAVAEKPKKPAQKKPAAEPPTNQGLKLESES